MTSPLNALLALNRLSGWGPVTVAKALSEFETPSELFGLSKEDLIPLFGEKNTDTLLQFKDWKKVDAEIAWMEKNGVTLVTIDDDLYPALLKETMGAPALLYFWGNQKVLNNKNYVGVVGSRKATPYGIKATKMLVEDLVKAGVGIASGYARGIDIAAHLKALECGGDTIAVMGCGLQTIYPADHKKYLGEFLKHGLIISEFPCDEEIQKFYFPRRNRVISGLSRGTLVVEADIKSGAMVTAKYALEQNRDVFAVPGPIDSVVSKGCHQLIGQGAKLVTCADDILNEWPELTPVQNVKKILKKVDDTNLSKEEKLILEKIRISPKGADELVELLNLQSAVVLSSLVSLELNNKIKSVAGNRYEVV